MIKLPKQKAWWRVAEKNENIIIIMAPLLFFSGHYVIIFSFLLFFFLSFNMCIKSIFSFYGTFLYENYDKINFNETWKNLHAHEDKRNGFFFFPFIFHQESMLSIIMRCDEWIKRNDDLFYIKVAWNLINSSRQRERVKHKWDTKLGEKPLKGFCNRCVKNYHIFCIKAP